ncbi:MAG TPA: hypothetical protein VFY54_19120 [Rubrobacter sp.]|nr:hypothetical protein [Rubrobacter sp.]
MEVYEAVVNFLRAFALAVGSAVIFAGIVRGVLVARGPGGRIRVARQLGEHAALGLDFFVAATLLNLAINPTLVTAAATALTIVVRKLVTLSLGLVWRGGGPTTGQ